MSIPKSSIHTLEFSLSHFSPLVSFTSLTQVGQPNPGPCVDHRVQRSITATTQGPYPDQRQEALYLLLLYVYNTYNTYLLLTDISIRDIIIEIDLL